MHRDHKYSNSYPNGKFYFFPLVILALFGFGLIVMWLWNAILPSVTGVEKLSYWQAVGLLILSRILFGGFWPGKKHYHGPSKARKWRSKWMSMNREERARFRQEWKHRCRPGEGEEQGE